MKNPFKYARVFSVQGHFLRHIKVREAKELLKATAEYPNGRAHQLSKTGEILEIRLRELNVQQGRRSPSGITMGEANVLVGQAFKDSRSRTMHMLERQKQEREKIGKPAEDRVERVEGKMAAWPFTGDDRAVRVGPRVTVREVARFQAAFA